MTAGDSGTPLAKKLNLRDGMRVWFDAMPEHVFEEIAEYALDLTMVGKADARIDAAHLFVTKRNQLDERLASLRQRIALDGQVWVSWPTADVTAPSGITEEAIRDAALPLGFLDTKRCAIDATWSALKLVIRKELR